MQVDGSQLAFCRYSARHTGNNNHSFVSPTRFHHVWMFGFQRLADSSHPCFTKRDMQLYGLSPCHPSAYCLFFCLFVYFFVTTTVPVDVFAPNSAWSGFYEYLGKRQTTTFTVTDFNASSGRVNVTLLESSGVSIRLSGTEHKMSEALSTHAGLFLDSFHFLNVLGKSTMGLTSLVSWTLYADPSSSTLQWVQQVSDGFFSCCVKSCQKRQNFYFKSQMKAQFHCESILVLSQNRYINIIWCCKIKIKKCVPFVVCSIKKSKTQCCDNTSQ